MPAAARRRHGRKRYAVVAVAVAVALVIAGAVALARRGGSGSEGVLPDEVFVTSYRIVYEVKEFGAEGRTEERLVKRPYSSKTVSERNGTPLTGSITNERGRWVLLSGERGWQLLDQRKQRAADDPRPIEALEAAAEDGTAQSRGTATVLGRRCTIIRTGGPLGDVVKPPTAKEHADLCIDRTGAVLRERWTLDGKLARVMVATEFEPNVRLDDDDFEPSPEAPPLPDEAGITRTRPVASGEAVPPRMQGVAGYEADGPMMVVERQVGRAGRDVSYAQFFVKGARLVVAEQGARSAGFEPRGKRIDLGDGATGHLELGLHVSTLTLLVEGDRYVLFRGADLDALEAFGRRAARLVGSA